MRHGYFSDIPASIQPRAAGAGGGSAATACPFGQYGTLFASGSAAPNRATAAIRDMVGAVADARASGVDDLPDNEYGGIPAGYTYFGQFVVHDLTHAVAAPGRGGTAALKNLSTPTLDLDTIYGGGPGRCPHLFQPPYLDQPGSDDDGQYLFHIGRTARAAFPQNWQQGHGLPFDLPRIDTGNVAGSYASPSAVTPLVNDDRNDDNLILGQLTAQFLLAHNTVASYLRRNGDPSHAGRTLDNLESFELAQHFLLKAYRQIVVHDHLQRLLLPGVYTDMIGGRLRPQKQLPVEFVFGAARTGHAMVRNSYTVNALIDLESSRLGRLMAFSSGSPHPNFPLPADWVVDWSGLLDMPAPDGRPSARPQSARRLSPFLAPTFVYGQLKGRRTGLEGSLSFHDLWRCYQFGLPTGQECAQRMFPGSPQKVLGGSDMMPTAAFAKLHPAEKLMETLSASANRLFLNETPLSYYLVQEAAVLGGNGRFLGPLGSHIFATAILHALQTYPQPPRGQRALTLDAIVAGRGIKTLPELLGIAGQSDVQLAETIAITLQ
jgi:hypothetical protein